MTCAGISGLALARARRLENSERIEGNAIRDCGKGSYDAGLARGLAWLASHFRIDQNFGSGAQWKYYYLYGLERAGRLAGERYIGEHEWYRLGAEHLIRGKINFQAPGRANWSRKTRCWRRALPSVSGQGSFARSDQQASSWPR